MRPGRLLRALAAIGLMLLPDERDALHLQRTPKEAALEARVHEQIAQLVPSFEVRPFLFVSVFLHFGVRRMGDALVTWAVFDPLFCST